MSPAATETKEVRMHAESSFLFHPKIQTPSTGDSHDYYRFHTVPPIFDQDNSVYHITYQPPAVNTLEIADDLYNFLSPLSPEKGKPYRDLHNTRSETFLIDVPSFHGDNVNYNAETAVLANVPYFDHRRSLRANIDNFYDRQPLMELEDDEGEFRVDVYGVSTPSSRSGQQCYIPVGCSQLPHFHRPKYSQRLHSILEKRRRPLKVHIQTAMKPAKAARRPQWLIESSPLSSTTPATRGFVKMLAGCFGRRGFLMFVAAAVLLLVSIAAWALALAMR
ncbi:hypothetical protein RUND412_010623 [Rhizina undulata]